MMTWTQVYDPLGHWWLSTLVAALPIVVLLGLLAGLKVRPHWCAIAGATTAVLCAIFVFGMPSKLALASFLYGGAFGLLKIVWIVIASVFLYDLSVAVNETGRQAFVWTEPLEEEASRQWEAGPGRAIRAKTSTKTITTFKLCRGRGCCGSMHSVTLCTSAFTKPLFPEEFA